MAEGGVTPEEIGSLESSMPTGDAVDRWLRQPKDQREYEDASDESAMLPEFAQRERIQKLWQFFQKIDQFRKTHEEALSAARKQGKGIEFDLPENEWNYHFLVELRREDNNDLLVISGKRSLLDAQKEDEAWNAVAKMSSSQEQKLVVTNLEKQRELDALFFSYPPGIFDVNGGKLGADVLGPANYPGAEVSITYRQVPSKPEDYKKGYFDTQLGVFGTRRTPALFTETRSTESKEKPAPIDALKHGEKFLDMVARAKPVPTPA